MGVGGSQPRGGILLYGIAVDDAHDFKDLGNTVTSSAMTVTVKKESFAKYRIQWCQPVVVPAK